MKEPYCKTKISTIALILVLAISAILVVLPVVNAQETMVTYPFLGVVPNPVGVNQQVLMHVGIFQQLSSVQMGWEDMSITIERPDGQTDTITGIRTDSTGGTGRTYTPNIVGTYKLTAHFPQQEVTETSQAPGISIGTVMLASSSAVVELVVQEEPIPYYPGHPLPAQYWTRPIDAQLREWSRVSGSWLEPGVGFGTWRGPRWVTGNDQAPESAHILWTKPLTWGGLAGGNTGEWAYSHGDAYEGKWTNRFIINGILLYIHRENDRPLEYTAVNLRTGEELWKKVLLDNQTIAFCQKLVWAGYNHHGVYPFFWVTIGSDWYAFDPYTGEWEFTVANVPSGTRVMDDQGWIYILNLDWETGEGYLWSMVHLIEPFGEDSPAAGSWLPGGSFYGARYQTYDAAAANETTGEPTPDVQRSFVANFTFPTDLPGGSGAVRDTVWNDKIFGLSYSTTEVNTWAISLEDGHEGAVLYNKSWNAPAAWDTGNMQIEFNDVDLEEGAAIIWTKDTLEYYAFNTDNGEYMWGPAEPEYYMNYYGWTEFGERPVLIADGKFYSTGAGGIVYCYDLTDGDVLWTYAADDPYQEYLFANQWWEWLLFITDGKVYLNHLEHSAIEPMPRGAPFLCLNATDGSLIWRADGLFRGMLWGGHAIIGDSVIATVDSYDQRVYAIGKGPSQTTVWIQDDVVNQGDSIMIKGRVTDVSPGTMDTNRKLRFPDGVPAVSDENMSAWMLYVYKQFGCPGDVKGVEVFLKILDPNGDWYSATVTADSNGRFSHMWAPAIVGEYQVTAMFEGSKSYYPSQETTTFGVDEAAAVDVPSAAEIADTTASRLPAYPAAVDIAQETVNKLPAYMTIDLIILIIVAIGVVIGLLVYMALRKQE
ncbi:MAG: PQQ-binding-like beta-propeller repeat protein [Candidatus Bathyarchaeota archaeon]